MLAVRAIALVAMSLVLAGGMGAPCAAQAPGKAGPPRFGTYDTRAIAVAWAASRHNPAAGWRAELEKARAAGDRDAVAALERRGRDLQRQLHFQGFGRVPVDDLLAPVAPGVAEVAARHGLAAIAPALDFQAQDVTVIDVTDDLVALFEPSGRTRTNAARIRRERPVPLVKLADLKAEH